MHFDTGDIHYLPIDDFVSFSNDMRDIIYDFNKVIFNNSLDIKIIVLPPEDGTFLNRMGIIMVGGAIFVSQAASFTDTGYGKGLITGLTGNSPEYYGQKHGELLRDVSIGFVEKTTKELNLIIMKEGGENLLERAYSCKNNFFKKCSENIDINGVQFARKFSDAIITREDFLDRINTEEMKGWAEHKLHELVIVAPVDVKNETQQWRMQDKQSGAAISFFMKDNQFLVDFLSGKFPLKKTEEDDTMIVMVKYIIQRERGIEKIVRKEATKVYKINQKELSPLPNDTSIEGIALSVERIRNNISEEQGSLFS